MREYLEGDKLEFTDGTSFILTSREACILNYVTLDFPLKEQEKNNYNIKRNWKNKCDEVNERKLKIGAEK